MIDRLVQRYRENFITLDSCDGNVDKSKLKAECFPVCIILMLWQCAIHKSSLSGALLKFNNVMVRKIQRTEG